MANLIRNDCKIDILLYLIQPSWRFPAGKYLSWALRFHDYHIYIWDLHTYKSIELSFCRYWIWFVDLHQVKFKLYVDSSGLGAEDASLVWRHQCKRRGMGFFQDLKCSERWKSDEKQTWIPGNLFCSQVLRDSGWQHCPWELPLAFLCFSGSSSFMDVRFPCPLPVVTEQDLGHADFQRETCCLQSSQSGVKRKRFACRFTAESACVKVVSFGLKRESLSKLLNDLHD